MMSLPGCREEQKSAVLQTIARARRFNVERMRDEEVGLSKMTKYVAGPITFFRRNTRLRLDRLTVGFTASYIEYIFPKPLNVFQSPGDHGILGAALIATFSSEIFRYITSISGKGETDMN